MVEILAGRRLDTQVAHLVFGTPIGELNRMDEVPPYSRYPEFAYTAIEHLKTRVRLRYDCSGPRLPNHGNSYSCLISVGDDAGTFVRENWGYGRTEALSICDAALEVVNRTPETRGLPSSH